MENTDSSMYKEVPIEIKEEALKATIHLRDSALTAEHKANLKLGEVQRRLKVKKAREVHNKHGKLMYTYRNVEDILETFKSLEGDNGHIVVSDELVEVAGRIFVRATATFTYETHSIPAVAHAELGRYDKMSAGQATGATSSYARKYALGGLLAVDDGTDLDSIEGGGSAKKQAVKPKKKPLSDDRFDKFLVGLSEANDNATVDKLVKMVETFELTKEQSTKAEHEVAKRRREIKSNEEITNAENMMI